MASDVAGRVPVTRSEGSLSAWGKPETGRSRRAFNRTQVICGCGREYQQPSPTLRCVCGQVVAIQNDTTESYKRAVAILADEAEAYLSAVGDVDEAADRIRWAIRRVSE